MIARRGTTLLELLVTIAVLAIVAGVAVLALRPPDRRPATARATLVEARQQAFRTRAPVTLTLVHDGHPAPVTVLPTGAIVAARELDVPQLLGERPDARR